MWTHNTFAHCFLSSLVHEGHLIPSTWTVVPNSLLAFPQWTICSYSTSRHFPGNATERCTEISQMLHCESSLHSSFDFWLWIPFLAFPCWSQESPDLVSFYPTSQSPSSLFLIFHFYFLTAVPHAATPWLLCCVLPTPAPLLVMPLPPPHDNINRFFFCSILPSHFWTCHLYFQVISKIVSPLPSLPLSSASPSPFSLLVSHTYLPFSHGPLSFFCDVISQLI